MFFFWGTDNFRSDSFLLLYLYIRIDSLNRLKKIKHRDQRENEWKCIVYCVEKRLVIWEWGKWVRYRDKKIENELNKSKSSLIKVLLISLSTYTILLFFLSFDFKLNLTNNRTTEKWSRTTFHISSAFINNNLQFVWIKLNWNTNKQNVVSNFILFQIQLKSSTTFDIKKSFHLHPFLYSILYTLSIISPSILTSVFVYIKLKTRSDLGKTASKN